MPPTLEKRLLQTAIALSALVPLLGGALGILQGAAMLGQNAHVPDVTADSHVRYLSGLLFAIGLGFLSAIPDIEKRGPRIALLSALVVTGGLARLLSVLKDGWPSAPMQFALGMELLVVPAIYVWQRRLARISSSNSQLRDQL